MTPRSTNPIINKCAAVLCRNVGTENGSGEGLGIGIGNNGELSVPYSDFVVGAFGMLNAPTLTL